MKNKLKIFSTIVALSVFVLSCEKISGYYETHQDLQEVHFKVKAFTWNDDSLQEAFKYVIVDLCQDPYGKNKIENICETDSKGTGSKKIIIDRNSNYYIIASFNNKKYKYNLLAGTIPNVLDSIYVKNIIIELTPKYEIL